MRNRYYDPSIGRFITEDPARDGLNWYVYCNNNPVNYIDPLGLWMTGDENLPQWAQDTITVYTAMWNSAKSDSERNIAHQGADAVRTFVATYYQSRSDWGAGMSTGSMDSITGARADYYNKLTYHHTNRPQYESMKSLQQAEQAGGEYSDVPYHFVIDGNGTVYEGRSLQYMGAHVKHDNPGNIGLALMGNFVGTDAQLGTCLFLHAAPNLCTLNCSLHIDRNYKYLHGSTFPEKTTCLCKSFFQLYLPAVVGDIHECPETGGS